MASVVASVPLLQRETNVGMSDDSFDSTHAAPTRDELPARRSQACSSASRQRRQVESESTRSIHIHQLRSEQIKMKHVEKPTHTLRDTQHTMRKPEKRQTECTFSSSPTSARNCGLPHTRRRASHRPLAAGRRDAVRSTPCQTRAQRTSSAQRRQRSDRADLSEIRRAANHNILIAFVIGRPTHVSATADSSPRPPL